MFLKVLNFSKRKIKRSFSIEVIFLISVALSFKALLVSNLKEKCTLNFLMEQSEVTPQYSGTIMRQR